MNLEGKTVIGYGIGFYYKATKIEISKYVKLDYLCDAKWDDKEIKYFEGIPVIKRKDIDVLNNPVLIVFTCNEPLINNLKREFDEKGYEFYFAMDILGAKVLSGYEIKKEGQEGLLKVGSNQIQYDETLPDNIRIKLIGFNSSVKIGRNLLIDSLSINVGSNCVCSIGNNVRVVQLSIDVAGADLIIGDDCLFSYNTEMRTHDSHAIFDLKTGKRINYPKETIVRHQVWVAAGAKLLAGSDIGVGSIVGANAVTSSKFPNNVVIAGNPAKIIRENVVWSKDNTAFMDFNMFSECASQDAKKYIDF